MRRATLLACQALVFAVYPLSRLWFILAPPTVVSDIAIYFDYATRAWQGHLPYVDYAIEYPPASFLLMLVPASTDWPTYFARFRGINAVFESVAFVMLLAFARRHFPARFWLIAATYVVVTTLARVVIYDRLDAGLLLLALVWVWLAWPAAGDASTPAVRSAAAYAVLGLATAFKLLPGAALLPALAADARGSLRRAAAGLAAFLAGVTVPFLVLMPWSGVAPAGFLRYHAARGIEIESVWAAILWVPHFFGANVSTVMADHALEIVAPGARAAARIADVCALLIVAVATLMAWWTRRASAGGILWGLLSLAAMTVASKVLSPQFLVWLLPLLVVAAAAALDDRRFIAGCAAIAAVAGLTAVMFPGHFMGMFNLQPSAWVLVAARNALLGGIVVWLWGRMRRWDQAGSSPA